jgi:CRP/FNR family cyclic AMP-dependent transcriptional regulator
VRTILILHPKGKMLTSLSPIEIESYFHTVGLTNTQVFLDKGAGIFTQGEECDSIFYIRDGRVQLSLSCDRSRQTIVAVLRSGDFASEECISALKNSRSASAMALTDCVLLRITKQEMTRAMDEVPGVSQLVVKYLLRNLNRIQIALLDQLSDPEDLN